MWWFRRRRREPPPVVLPALDRLAELVERVVALLDARPGALVAEAQEPVAAPPERDAHSVRVEPVPDRGELPLADGWVAFVAGSAGYRLVSRGGAPPGRGEVVELEGERFLVLRLGPSPLPGDPRRCAFVEREEPPSAGGSGHG